MNDISETEAAKIEAEEAKDPKIKKLETRISVSLKSLTRRADANLSHLESLHGKGVTGMSVKIIKNNLQKSFIELEHLEKLVVRRKTLRHQLENQ